MTENPEPKISPELVAKLQQSAEVAKDDHADHDTYSAAESALSILYEEEGAWRINYTLPRKAVIGLNNRQPAELAKAQLRGMLADFCFRQTNSLQARVEALSAALREQAESIWKEAAEMAEEAHCLDLAGDFWQRAQHEHIKAILQRKERLRPKRERKRVSMAKWIASNYLDDGRWGVLSEYNEIIVGASSRICRETAEEIASDHNRVEALSAALREILLAYDADEGWPQAMEAARKELEEK